MYMIIFQQKIQSVPPQNLVAAFRQCADITLDTIRMTDLMEAQRQRRATNANHQPGSFHNDPATNQQPGSSQGDPGTAGNTHKQNESEMTVNNTADEGDRDGLPTYQEAVNNR